MFANKPLVLGSPSAVALSIASITLLRLLRGPIESIEATLLPAITPGPCTRVPAGRRAPLRCEVVRRGWLRDAGRGGSIKVHGAPSSRARLCSMHHNFELPCPPRSGEFSSRPYIEHAPAIAQPTHSFTQLVAASTPPSQHAACQTSGAALANLAASPIFAPCSAS